MLRLIETYTKIQRYNYMITKDELLKKIGELLDELKTQHELLTKGNEGERKLETELFEANASYFASHVSILNKLISSDQEAVDTGSTAAGQETGIVDDADDEDLPEVNPEPVEETIFTPATVVPEEKPDKEDEADEDYDSGQNDDEDQTTQEDQAGQEEYSPDQDNAEGAQDESAEEQDEVKMDDEPDHNDEPDQADEVEANPDEEGAEEAVADEEEPEEAAGDAEKMGYAANQVKQHEDTATGASANENGRARTVVQEVQIEKKEVTIPDEQPSRPLTLNERLSAQRTQQAGSYYQAPSSLQQSPQRVSDLKTAISLNDKLLFIRDLFNGYSLAYSEAIELLNRFDNFADAQAFLEKNYAEKNNWASKQQAAEKLYGILRKKFG